MNWSYAEESRWAASLDAWLTREPDEEEPDGWCERCEAPIWLDDDPTYNWWNARGEVPRFCADCLRKCEYCGGAGCVDCDWRAA